MRRYRALKSRVTTSEKIRGGARWKGWSFLNCFMNKINLSHIKKLRKTIKFQEMRLKTWSAHQYVATLITNKQNLHLYHIWCCKSVLVGLYFFLASHVISGFKYQHFALRITQSLSATVLSYPIICQIISEIIYRYQFSSKWMVFIVRNLPMRAFTTGSVCFDRVCTKN